MKGIDEGKYFDINALPDDTKAIIWKNEKKNHVDRFYWLHHDNYFTKLACTFCFF